MRLAGLLRGPDEQGNVLILPTAARYNATYDKQEYENTLFSSTRTKSKAKSVTKPTNMKLPAMR
jgi:hypothetical protein